MSLFAVHYSYVRDADLLQEHRPSHRDFLRKLLDSGPAAAGAYPETDVPGALLIVDAETSEDVARMLDADPFQLRGIITERRIQLWNPPMGIFA